MEKPIEKALDECLFFSVKKLDRMLNKLADEAFRRTGLAPTYGFILLILKEKDGIP
ncbi:TPA: MarR family transcriptional regulator, partial [Enterococcus faecium]